MKQITTSVASIFLANNLDGQNNIRNEIIGTHFALSELSVWIISLWRHLEVTTVVQFYIWLLQEIVFLEENIV